VTRLPTPVTDDDVRAAFEAYYARPSGLEHIGVEPPLNDSYGAEILSALRRALECDRKRAVERSGVA